MPILAVAPHWGAWIEITSILNRNWTITSHPTGVRGLKWPTYAPISHAVKSHPTGVRGLKCIIGDATSAVAASHPTGVRGLKCLQSAGVPVPEPVAPHWGAWIEISYIRFLHLPERSHPTGVRGLKFKARQTAATEISRTPLGCVD